MHRVGLNRSGRRISPVVCFAAAAIVAATTSAQPAADTPGAGRHGARPSERSEPLTWDECLLFLLRIIHDLYGGDPSEITEGMDPVVAMNIVATHYTTAGSPPSTLMQRLQAQATILQC